VDLGKTHANQYQHHTPRAAHNLPFANAYSSPDRPLAYSAVPNPPITGIQSTAISSHHPSHRLPWSPDPRTNVLQITQPAARKPQQAIVNRATPDRPIMGLTPWHTIEEIVQCFVCLMDHVPGRCPLRTSTTETCPACGYHHLHSRKACPLLQDPEYIDTMYRRLNESTEDRQVVRAAKTYLAGIRGNLSQQNRRK
jgi:hypothetical protein